MRRFAVLVLLDFAAIWFIIATSSKLEPPLEAYDNPLVLTTSDLYAAALAIPLVVACLASIVAAAVIVVRRFRRSRGDERQQFKWFATSAGFLVVTVPIATAFNWTGIGGIVITFQLIALPVSVGIAVLRYRLYEIDVIIRRTLVYGTLSVLLAGTYVAVVIGLQALFSSFAGGSNLAIAASTLAVAALFMPVRSRVQRFVDRRFYRRRYDAQRTLEALRRAAARAGRARRRCAVTSRRVARDRCSRRTCRSGFAARSSAVSARPARWPRRLAMVLVAAAAVAFGAARGHARRLHGTADAVGSRRRSDRRAAARQRGGLALRRSQACSG